MAYNYGLLWLIYGLHWGIVAYNYGLLSANYGLLWGIVAHYFGLLGVPCRACTVLGVGISVKNRSPVSTVPLPFTLNVRHHQRRAISFEIKGGWRVSLESQVAQNDMLRFPKVAQNPRKVTPNHGLLAGQVSNRTVHFSRSAVQKL